MKLKSGLGVFYAILPRNGSGPILQLLGSTLGNWF